MSSPGPITFYDIPSAPPRRTFAPNPWKIRFALNHKKVSYRTQWTNMPDIASLRQSLGVPANRTLPDGTPYHTLPMIQDPSTGALVGDSFEIALYLDATYPSAPSLFRPSATGLTAAFNAYVDGIFTKHAGLCSSMPLDPDAEAASREMFLHRAGATTWEDLQMSSEQRVEMMKSFESALGELAKAYKHTGGTTDYVWLAGGTGPEQRQRAPPGREEAGPWLDAEGPVYADFVVGAWLKMFEASLEAADWARLREWHGGVWGKVVDALDPWTEIK